MYIVHTASCNQVGTVFAEMSSWTAVTRHLRMKTKFQAKSIKSKMFCAIPHNHSARNHATEKSVAMKNPMSHYTGYAVRCRRVGRNLING